MLGLPLYNISRKCPAYNNELCYIYGDHSLIVELGVNVLIVIIMYEILYTIYSTIVYIIHLVVSPSLETANSIPGIIRRPVDISVNKWSLGKSAAIDVSITSLLQNTIILSAAIEVGEREI